GEQPFHRYNLLRRRRGVRNRREVGRQAAGPDPARLTIMFPPWERPPLSRIRLLCKGTLKKAAFVYPIRQGNGPSARKLRGRTGGCLGRRPADANLREDVTYHGECAGAFCAESNRSLACGGSPHGSL